MKDDAGGTTIKQIYITVVDKMNIAVPENKQEQKVIAIILIKLAFQIKLKQSKLTQTKSLKKSLMQDLLTGKVRVKPD